MRKLHILAAAAAMTAGSLFADVQIGKGLSVSGYLDMTYQQASVDTAVSTAAPASADTAGFNATTAEIDFAMDFGGGLTAQIDLEGSVASDNSATKEIAVEQARIDYAIGQGSLTLGKFDTFIGLEGLEAPDLYQYSNSLTFALEPTQHEGLLYSFDNGNWNFAFAIVNSLGSDNANSNGDSEELSYAAHVGFTPSEALSFNLNYGTESEDATGTVVNSEYNLITADVSYSNHGWTVGAEYVSIDPDLAGAVETTGYMLMANYMINEQFGLTGRYSTTEEDTAGVTADATEFTFAASYAVTPNWSALIEYRSEEFDAGHTGTGGMAAAGDSEANIITLETILTF
jgi:hypothetical protein